MDEEYAYSEIIKGKDKQIMFLESLVASNEDKHKMYEEIVKAKDQEIADLKAIIDNLTKRTGNPYMNPNNFYYTEATYPNNGPSKLDDICDYLGNLGSKVKDKFSKKEE